MPPGKQSQRNALLFREVNERIREVSISWLERESQDLLCECGDPTCMAMIAVVRADFQAVEDQPGRFLLASRHADDAGTRILACRDGYLTVEFVESPA